jgi:hypothetical protein
VRRLHLIGLIAGLGVSSLAANCVDINISGPVAKIKYCEVRSTTNNWPTDANSFLQIDKPSECPFKLYLPTQLPYAANGKFAANDVQYNIVRTEFRDSFGLWQGTINGGTWGSTSPAGYYNVVVGGLYKAAEGGFGPTGKAADTASTFINRWNGAEARANAVLSYEWGDPLHLMLVAPTDLLPGTPFTVQAYVTDPLAVGPMTYRWLRNGVDIGINAPSFTTNSGAMGTTQEWDFQATDLGSGRVSGATAVSQTKNCNFVGCNDQ